MSVAPDDDATARRLTVVDQALRLFAEKGYEATTVDEIADAAGISRRTFFRQFRSKEDVVFADHESQLAQARAFLERRGFEIVAEEHTASAEVVVDGQALPGR